MNNFLGLGHFSKGGDVDPKQNLCLNLDITNIFSQHFFGLKKCQLGVQENREGGIKAILAMSKYKQSLAYLTRFSFAFCIGIVGRYCFILYVLV